MTTSGYTPPACLREYLVRHKLEARDHQWNTPPACLRKNFVLHKLEARSHQWNTRLACLLEFFDLHKLEAHGHNTSETLVATNPLSLASRLFSIYVNSLNALLLERTVRRTLWLLGLGCTLLLIYASIVPLQYTPIPWEDSLTRWRSIPWIELGVYNRADWVANGLVVMPSAFLLCGAILWRRANRIVNWLLSLVLVVILCSLVFGIECLQVWFPPRTVSQNDIYAGIIGAGLGSVAWLLMGELVCGAFIQFASIETNQKRLRFVTLTACVGCFLYSIFPFDLVLTREEILEKIRLNRLSIGGPFAEFGGIAFAKGLVVSFAKVFPFGVWLALGKRRKRHIPLLFVIALILELIQIPIFSKYATVPEGFAGFVGGIVGYYAVVLFPTWQGSLRSRAIAWLGVVFWGLAVVAMFNLRFDSIVTEPTAIASRWSEFFSPPLLRYYYTSEYSALSNLAGKTIVFSIFGVWLGLIEFFQIGGRSKSLFWWGLLLVILMGIMIEAMQVYLAPLVADATDVAIYAAGYTGGYTVTRLVLSSENGHSAEINDPAKDQLP